MTNQSVANSIGTLVVRYDTEPSTGETPIVRVYFRDGSVLALYPESEARDYLFTGHPR